MIPDFSSHYAFLVGIDEYDHAAVRNLHGARSDAEAVRQTLLRIGYPADNISLITGEGTNLSDLDREWTDFCGTVRASRKNGNIVVFWAGHGARTESEGYLLARNTDPKHLDVEALRVSWLTERLVGLRYAAVTMFFDVCHSVGATDLPRETALSTYRAAGATVVGVATLAYEVRPERGGARGLLTAALRTVLLGEQHDTEPERCYLRDGDQEFAVTARIAADRMEEIVRRTAAVHGVTEKVVVRTDSGTTAHLPIGFALRAFRSAGLEALRLPVAADMLARSIVERDVDDVPSERGHRLEHELDRLLSGETTTSQYIRSDAVEVGEFVLVLRHDRTVGPFVPFLLFCRQNVEFDDGAREVVETLHEHLLATTTDRDLAASLHDPYRTFAVREALPWSCGIKAVDEEGAVGYAPIARRGASLPPVPFRYFETTALLQNRARLQVCTSAATTPYPILERIATLPRELQRGAGVWVQIGPDPHGCRTAADRTGCTGARVSVPMCIRIGAEGETDHESHHWHLELDEQWLPHVQVGNSAALDSWGQLRLLVDDCMDLVHELLHDDSIRDDDSHADDLRVLVDNLFRVDVAVRLLNESRVLAFVTGIVAGWRNRGVASEQRMCRRLARTIGASVDDTDTEAVLAEYERWADVSAGRVVDRRAQADLRALILRAVSARDSEKNRHQQALGEFVLRADGGQRLALALRFLTSGAERDDDRATALVTAILRASNEVDASDGDPADLERLGRWRERATHALADGSTGAALREFVELLPRIPGLGTRVLVLAMAAAGTVSEYAVDGSSASLGGTTSEQMLRAQDIYRTMADATRRQPVDDLLIVLATLFTSDDGREYILTVLSTTEVGSIALEGLELLMERRAGLDIRSLGVESADDSVEPRSLAFRTGRTKVILDRVLAKLQDTMAIDSSDDPPDVDPHVGPGEAGIGRPSAPGSGAEQLGGVFWPDRGESLWLQVRSGEPFERDQR